MTGFHPDAVIRDVTLSDHSATRQHVAAGRTGTGVSCSRAFRQWAWPDSRRDPPTPNTPARRIVRWLTKTPKDTARKTSLFFGQSCSIFRIETSVSDRRQESLGGQSRGRTNSGFFRILSQCLESRRQRQPDVVEPEVRFGTDSDFGFKKSSRFPGLPEFPSESPHR